MLLVIILFSIHASFNFVQKTTSMYFEVSKKIADSQIKIIIY